MVAILRQSLAAILTITLAIPLNAIAKDPNGVNGSVSYTHDMVGNRTQKGSTLPGYPGGLSNYNANDELATDAYDANGNTTVSNGLGYVHDFENHPVQAGAGISYVYHGDGNRVSNRAPPPNEKWSHAPDCAPFCAHPRYKTIANGSHGSRAGINCTGT
jgi:hypothetical protein